MKNNNLLLLIATVFLLSGCSEKTIKTMDSNSKQDMLDLFQYEYQNQFDYVKNLSITFLEPGHEYYDPDILKVELLNQYTYYTESGIFELSCYYDKEAKKWQYLGYNSFNLDKKLDILGEWGFSVWGGLEANYSSEITRYYAYMDIKEIKDNQVLIAMRLNNGVTIDEQWYKLHKIEKSTAPKEAGLDYPEHFRIYNIITVPPVGRRGKNIKYTITITYDNIVAHCQDYQEESEIRRLSTYTENNYVN